METFLLRYSILAIDRCQTMYVMFYFRQMLNLLYLYDVPCAIYLTSCAFYEIDFRDTLFDMCCGLAAKCLNYVKKKFDPLLVIGIKRSIFLPFMNILIMFFNTLEYRWFRAKSVQWCIDGYTSYIRAFTLLSVDIKKEEIYMNTKLPNNNKAYDIILYNISTRFYAILSNVYDASQSKNVREIYHVSMKYWVWRVASDE